jgi:hypothetical protein
MSKAIKLSQEQEALVDDWRYKELNIHQWSALWCETTKSFYAVRHSRDLNGKRILLRMHSVIANTPKGMETDHINRNTLDNREENLRTCTHAQNQRNRVKNKNNTSGYKGVFRSGKKWQARIWIGKQLKYIGTWDTAQEAAIAYDKIANELHGEFANTNFQ